MKNINENIVEGFSSRIDIRRPGKKSSKCGLTFSGHDTTASSITWALYEFARHPEIQNKVREELEEVLADRKDSKIEWYDLKFLQFKARNYN